MTTYTIYEYIQSKSDLEGKITAIDTLINNMLAKMLEVVSNEGTATYSLDDGQSKISTTYRSVEEVEKGIFALEKLKNLYVRRYSGRAVVLRGGLNNCDEY